MKQNKKICCLDLYQSNTQTTSAAVHGMWQTTLYLFSPVHLPGSFWSSSVLVEKALLGCCKLCPLSESPHTLQWQTIVKQMHFHCAESSPNTAVLKRSRHVQWRCASGTSPQHCCVWWSSRTQLQHMQGAFVLQLLLERLEWFNSIIHYCKRLQKLILQSYFSENNL